MAKSPQTRVEQLQETFTPVQPQDAMSEAVRKALLVDFMQMLTHEEGSRSGDDIEDVHQMRVATRRMRSMFRLLGHYFDAKVVRVYRHQLREIASRLGVVRDLDVMIDDLEKFKVTLEPETQAGLQGVINLLDKQRKSARKQLVKHLDSDDYQKFVKRFQKFLTKPGVGSAPLYTNGHGVTPYRLQHVLPALLYEHLAVIRAFDDILTDADDETLHALRIEFKKLRYIFNPFADNMGSQAKKFIAEIKAIQDQLGRFNDAVVAHDRLSKLLPELNKVQVEALERYLAALEQQATERREGFAAVWSRFNTRTVQRQLSSAVASLG